MRRLPVALVKRIVEAVNEALPDGVRVDTGPWPSFTRVLVLSDRSGSLSTYPAFLTARLRPTRRRAATAAARAAMRSAREGVLARGQATWPPGVRAVDRVDAVAEIYDGLLHMSYQVADTPVLRLRPVPFDDHQPR